MSRKATVSLVPYAPVSGDVPDRLGKTLEKMASHVAEAATLNSLLAARRKKHGSSDSQESS